MKQTKKSRLWLAAVAFRAPVEPSDVLQAYAATARYWQAVLGQERFAALRGDLVHPPGLLDRAMMLPQLWPSKWRIAKSRKIG